MVSIFNHGVGYFRSLITKEGRLFFPLNPYLSDFIPQLQKLIEEMVVRGGKESCAGLC